jgi:UDP-N-acetyl-D-galactosamine dehydrogenase
MADPADAMHEYGVELVDIDALQPADAVIMAVAHQSYIKAGWPLIQKLLTGGRGLVLDVKMKLDRSSLPDGVELWRL